MRPDRWFLGTLVLLATTALVGAGCNSSSQSGTHQAIVIGLLTDLTGPVKSFGTDIQAAVNLAIGEINDDGGVNGSDLKLIVKDTSLQPDEAVTDLRELTTASHAFAILGPVSSGEAEVVFTQAPRLSVPVATGTANKEGITDLGKGWAFRDTATSTQLYVVAMPKYATKFGVHSVAIVFDEMSPGLTGAAEHSVPGVAQQLGINVAGSVAIDTGQTDFSTAVQKIKDLNAEGLVVQANPVEAGLLERELLRQNVKLPVLGAPNQMSPAFQQSAGGTVSNWVVPTIFFNPAVGPKGQAFFAAMEKLDKEPPTVPEAANYYDLVYMIAQVARSAGIDGGTDPVKARAAIRKGLAGLKGFAGAAGNTTFLPNGDTEKRVYTVLLGTTNTLL